MALWQIRIPFLFLCAVGGYAVSQVRPEMIQNGALGLGAGLLFGGVLIALDELVKGFSLRAFSAVTFAMVLGTLIAMMVDRSGLFDTADEATRWLIRLCLFLGLGYIGVILAMRSNKEDFSLIIPYVRFSPQNRPDNLILLDTSVIIDGRIADLIESGFVEGVIVVPRFVLRELQVIADANDPTRQARGRRGLEMLSRLQRSPKLDVKIHEADFADEKEVDAKLVRLAKMLGAKLFTNDYNLGKIAELQSVPHVSINEMARALKPLVHPGESIEVRIVREGREKGQGVGYLSDGTMVVVNQSQRLVGQNAEVQVLSLLQTGTGTIVFADLKSALAA